MPGAHSKKPIHVPVQAKQPKFTFGIQKQQKNAQIFLTVRY